MHRSFICLVISFLTCTVYAQPRLETQLKYTKVHLDESIHVTFVFHDGELGTFDKPDLQNFKIVSGPMQSSTRSTTIEHGVEVNKSSVRMSYVLKAPHKGVYEIGRAKATTKDGNTYYSDPVKVEVAGNNEEIERTANYPMLENDMTGFMSKAMNVQADYVVATGPLFYHKGAKVQRNPAALMKDILAAAGGSHKAEELAIYLWDSTKPRLYITMDDTSDVLQQLARLYAGYGDGQYFTKVATRGSFVFGESPGTISRIRDYYLGFENMKPWLVSQGRDTTQPRVLHYTWIFSRKNSRDVFNNRVAQLGYAIDSLNEEAVKYDKTVIFYSVTISKRTELKDEVMWRKADELLDIAESLEASFSSMTVEKDK